MLGNLLSGGAADLVKNVGGVIDNLHTSKEEKLEAERKIKELVANYEVEIEKNITARWEADLKSYLYRSLLLQLVLITVIGAYFGGRSLEKVKK